MSRVPLLILCTFLILVSGVSLSAQQADINRYTLFTGFDYMISPARNLTERGFETDFGVTAKPWLGLGVDFGFLSGAGTITGTETVYAPAVNGLLGPRAAGSIHVPFNSTTDTVASRPQFYIRRCETIDFLIRPGFGGMHARADIMFPSNLGLLFQGLGVPAPAMHQSDTRLFFGMGAGFDLNLS